MNPNKGLVHPKVEPQQNKETGRHDSDLCAQLSATIIIQFILIQDHL